jgi:hypothetical protein
LQLAQVPSPNILPTDVTPVGINEERGLLSPWQRFRILQKLPARFWFTSTTEVSQRLDTNVFFTHNNYKPDYAFRVLPNLTLGYNLLKNTSVYANYFVIKDTFADHTSLNFPTTQSLGWGLVQDMQLGKKVNAQFNFMVRELWQTAGVRQSDLLPSVNITQALSRNTALFYNVVLQMRSGEYFEGPTRELDPFFTVGMVRRHGLWGFVASNTYVWNVRGPTFHNSIPEQSNMTMIGNLEVYRPVFKQFPSLVAFVRAQPIWNWDSHDAPGLSGFDFRLFTGLRLQFGKRSYLASMQQLKKQILETETSSSENENGDTQLRGPMTQPAHSHFIRHRHQQQKSLPENSNTSPINTSYIRNSTDSQLVKIGSATSNQKEN